MTDSGSVDPNFFLDQLQQMKTIVSTMLPKALMRYPGQVDKQLQGLLRQIDAAVKAFQEAQQHMAAMQGAGPSGQGSNPIDFAGAQVSQSAGLPAMV